MLGMILMVSLIALPIPSLAIEVFYTNYAQLGIGEPLSSWGWFLLSGGIALSLFGIIICAAIKSFVGVVLAAIGSFMLGLCIYAGIVNVLYAALSTI